VLSKPPPELFLQVDEALEELVQRKSVAAVGQGMPQESSLTTVSIADLATEGLRVRAAMAKAVQEEK
jgi:hypothetical protein